MISDFERLILDQSYVVNVTKLRRVYNRRILIYIGNKNGMISFGIGKGEDYETAIVNCLKKCKRNMVLIALDQKHTCPRPIGSRFNDFRLMIMPSNGFNVWGNPLIFKMLIGAGIRHCSFYCKSRKRNRYAMVNSFVISCLKNQTMQEIALEKGMKISEINKGNPSKYQSGVYY